MSSSLDSDAEELRQRADREKAKATSSGRKASQAGLGILKKYKNLAEKTAKFRQQTPQSEPVTTVPLRVENSEISVEHLRGTMSKDTNRGKDNHPLLDLPPEVIDTTRGAKATESSGGTNHPSLNIPPVVNGTIGGISESAPSGTLNHAWSDILPVVSPTTGGIFIQELESSVVDSVSEVSADRETEKASSQRESEHSDYAINEPLLNAAAASEANESFKTETFGESFNEEHFGSSEGPVVKNTTGGNFNHPVEPRRSAGEIVEQSVGDLKHETIVPPVVHSTTGSVAVERSVQASNSETQQPEEFIPAVVDLTTGGISGEDVALDGLSFFTDEFKERQKNSMAVQPQNGEFHIPHELFQAIVVNIKRTSDRDVYCCLIRCSLGWHKDWCEAAHSYIAKWTNIQDKSNVAKALKRLIDRGLIEVLEEPNYKQNRGTTYRIPLATSYLQKKGKTPEPWTGPVTKHSIPPVVKQTTGSISNPGSDELPTGGTTHYPRVVSRTTNKEPLKEHKKELSPSSEKLASYIATIPTKGQRDTERAFLTSLMEDGIKEDVIEKCLADLNRFGVPPHGVQCMMPMKWLYASGAAMIRKHQAVSAPPSPVVDTEASEENLSEEHPRWSEYTQWRQALSEADIVVSLMGSSGQTEVQARHLLLVMEKEAGKKLMVEALLRADFLNRANTHKGQA